MREALQADGVLFTDGLIGYHGAIQPLAQLKAELEREIVQRLERERFPEEILGDNPSSAKEQADVPLHQHQRTSDA